MRLLEGVQTYVEGNALAERGTQRAFRALRLSADMRVM